jgi:hypothetical protein
MMSNEQRQRIIFQISENVRRFEFERSGLASDASAWPSDRPAVRPVGDVSSCAPAGRVQPADPPLDPVRKWREDGERIEQMREQGRAEIRREEREHIRQHELDWSAVDARIAAAIEAERSFMTETLCDALRAMNEIGDATADKFEQLDGKLAALSKLLETVRTGTERSLARARARAEAESSDVSRVPIHHMPSRKTLEIFRGIIL